MRILFDDPHLCVVDKPAGRDSTDVSGDLLVVHRLDKLTSGLLVYARTPGMARRLTRQFAARTTERTYTCVAYGTMTSTTIRSHLVRNRGDGLRGSGSDTSGKLAITHVVAGTEHGDRTTCDVTLETGRTHQIRIHFAEAGHPIVGETVYVRDHRARGLNLLPSSRLMLHAAVLGFTHPALKERLRFNSPAPW